MQKKKTLLLLTVLIVTLLLLYFIPIQIPFTIQSKAMVFAKKEWELFKNSNGNLLSVNRNNLSGQVQSFSINEFQRGDVVFFQIHPSLYSKTQINEGDTIGNIYSNEEQRNLIALQADLDILQAELELNKSGQKPEDIETAKKELALAIQEYETQQKLSKRSQILYKDSVISTQQLEIDMNELLVKEQRMLVAQAKLSSISTGERIAQLNLIQQKINGIQSQIEQIKTRINYYTIVAPISGKISIGRVIDLSSSIPENESIFKIIEDDSLVIYGPIDLRYKKLFSINNTFTLNQDPTVKGYIYGFDNQSKIINFKNRIYITGSIPFIPEIEIGSIQEIDIKGNSVSLWNYLLYKLGFA